MSDSPLPTHIVYGVTDVGTPRLMDRATAEYLAALFAAQTWGELRRDLPETAAEVEAEAYTDLGEDAPPDEERFELELLPGYEDGDAPVWPAQELLAWLPDALTERYVRVDDSVFNGPFGEIDAADLEPLAAALRDLGCTVERDDALISRAEQR